MRYPWYTDRVQGPARTQITVKHCRFIGELEARLVVSWVSFCDMTWMSVASNAGRKDRQPQSTRWYSRAIGGRHRGVRWLIALSLLWTWWRSGIGY